MALSNAYLMTSKNLEAMLAAIRNAQAPEKFTIKFLESLGFSRTNPNPCAVRLNLMQYVE
jgi:hypothetical protein